jgi:predicted transcriptional regulator
MEAKKKDLEAKVEGNNALQMTSDIVASFVSKNSVKAAELPTLMQDVYAAVLGLAGGDVAYSPRRDPAVPINKSVTPEFIICLEDGKKLKMLKRYLRTHYDMSVEDYKRKWGLPADYPTTAPSYAKRRSVLAKKIGLGTAANTARRAKPAKRKARAAVLA